MLKVVQFIPTLTTGGAETMVRDYCLLFDKEKIDVHVVVVDHRLGTYNEKILDDAGIRVTYLSELKYGSNYNLNIVQKLIRKVSRYYCWRRIVLSERPDIIHMHLHLDKYMKVLPLRDLNCSLIMTIHNVIDNFFSKNKQDREKYSEYREVSRLIDGYGMKLVTLHDKLAEELAIYFNTDNVETINNGVILDRFKPSLYDREAVREGLGIAKGQLLIGNVASMSRQKNHDLMLDVFEKIIADGYDAKLLLVGQGALKKQIEERIAKAGLEDKVIILSNRGDIPELMSAMDVFFFPSRWEGFGNVMIEAQSMGLRCVVSDAVPECTFVSDNVTVCRLDDSLDIWCGALLNEDSQTHARVGDISNYDMKNCVKKLEETYLQLRNGC